MEERKFKFELGQIVKHKVGYTPILIIGRSFTETIEGVTMENYIVSDGTNANKGANVFELEAVEDKN